MLTLSSCINFNKQLTHEKYEGKNVLYTQKLKGNKNASSYELEEILDQHPNRKFIFPFLMPYTKAYLIGEKRFDPNKVKSKYKKKKQRIDNKIAETTDSSKVNKLERKKAKISLKEQTILKDGNWLMRTVGDPPALYDSLKAESDLKQLQLYYQSNGYFKSQITRDSTLKNRKVKLKYVIEENTPYTINKVFYECEKKEIHKLLVKQRKAKHLRKGQNYSEDRIANERERMFRLLKDNGYFDFQRQYIYFDADSTVGKNRINIYAGIDLPSENEQISYTLKEIYFLMDINGTTEVDTIEYEGIKFLLPKGEKTSLKILNSNVKIRPGSPYNMSNTQSTQQKLGNIDIFKFVNITFQKQDSNSLVGYIHANSLKKYQITTEVGMNLNVNQGQGLPGPFINLSFKDRKVFNGLEILDINARYSIEGQVGLTDQEQFFRSTEWGVNASLWFPKLLIPGKFKYNLNNLYPRTRLQIGLTNIERMEYHRRTINISGNYQLQNRKNQRIIFTPLDFNLINTTNKTEAFQSYLEALRLLGNNLISSFDPSIIESMSLSYVFNNNDLTKNKRAFYLRVLTESGGQTVRFLHNSSPNSGQDDLVFGLPYYQFYKLNSEFRVYRPVSQFSNVVFRLNTGIARPYGISDVLPYEKFYFSGGLNSNRAWNPRRLGPGTFLNYNEDGDPDYSFEQQGEVIIETNLEYRGKLGGFLHGAAFVDIGNVWVLNADETRPGAEFRTQDLWKQFAVGAGLGLRFDFSFLIFRFDVGEKIWDPGRQQIIPFNDKFARVYNIGIGYPF